MYRENYTLICKYTKTEIVEEDKCYCFDDYWSMATQCWCNAPSNPRVKYTKVLVYTVGNPIKTKPHDTVYNVQIYETDTTQNDTKHYEFDEFEMVVEFSLVNSISHEMNNEHRKVVKTYLSDTGNPLPGYGKFKGQSSIHSYILAFQCIVNKSLATPKLDVKNKENAHISRKKKKR